MPQMKTPDVETRLQKAFGIDIDAAIQADPGSAHNLREEWGATVDKVEKFVNRIAVQAKPAGGAGGTDAKGTMKETTKT